jgi:hypothetical protein
MAVAVFQTVPECCFFGLVSLVFKVKFPLAHASQLVMDLLSDLKYSHP